MCSGLRCRVRPTAPCCHERRSGHTQFIRYALIGVVSNLVLYLGYIRLTLMGIDPKLAMSLLYGVGVVQTFTFNNFRAPRGDGAGLFSVTASVTDWAICST